MEKESELKINEDHDYLPEFTWEEVNERVQYGVSLVIYFIYN